MKSPFKQTVGDTVNIHNHLSSESQNRITVLRSRLRNGSSEKKSRFEGTENGKRELKHQEIFEKANQLNDKLARTIESERANFESLSERIEKLHHMMNHQSDCRLSLEVNKKQDLNDLGMSLSREVISH